MRVFAAFLTLMLSACNGPGPAFRHVDPVTVRAGDVVFDVRVKGSRAEVVRRGALWAPRPASVAVPAVLVIERVTGCRVDRLTGDQAMMRATLDCGDGAPAPRSPRPYLECDAFDLDDEGGGELLCYPF